MNFRITHINPTMNSNLKNSKGTAFTLVGLLAILAILAILAAMLLPALAKAKLRAKRIGCVNNLKQVGLAFKTWSLGNNDKYPMAVSNKFGGTLEFVAGGNAFRHFQVMSNEISAPKILVCPDDVRQPATRFERLQNENLSYFVGLDANDTQPQMFLSGDHNIVNGVSPAHTVLELRPELPTHWTETIHNNQGNIGLSDGSVQQYTTVRLQQALQNTGDSTNRIALPE
jgi:competence protein ComGC